MQRLLALLICAAASEVLGALSLPLLAQVAAEEADQVPPRKPMEESYRGPLAELTPEQIDLRNAMRIDVEHLAGKIGERNLRRYPQLQAAATYIEKSLIKFGYRVGHQSYQVRRLKCDNLEVEVRGGKLAKGWSDQWSFWQEGYRGLMVTDTAPFRYPYYHDAKDTPDKIDYDRLARVVDGVARAVGDLANRPPPSPDALSK